MRRLLLLAGVALAAGAFAQDHKNLEQGLPTRVEDAYPIAFMGREAQFLLRYERTNGGKDRYLIDSRYEWGFKRNWQARLSVPYQFGNADKGGGGYASGNVAAEAFYNFNVESLTLPAVAVSVAEEFPTGEGGGNYETTLKLIGTKTLGYSSLLHRVHANLAYTYASAPSREERKGRFTGVLGYGRRLSTVDTFVLDGVYEQERKRGRDALIGEVGLRHSYDPLTVVSFGVGAGLNRDAPDFRVTFGIQRTF